MFSHPFSHAVRQEFLLSVRRGIDASLAVTQLQSEYGDALLNGATECRFFCAASFTAWQCGLLYDDLQCKALKSIEMHSAKLERCTGIRHVSTGLMWRLTDILRRPQNPRVDLSNAATLRLLDAQMRDLELVRETA